MLIPVLESMLDLSTRSRAKTFDSVETYPQYMRKLSFVKKFRDGRTFIDTAYMDVIYKEHHTGPGRPKGFVLRIHLSGHDHLGTMSFTVDDVWGLRGEDHRPPEERQRILDAVIQSKLFGELYWKRTFFLNRVERQQKKQERRKKRKLKRKPIKDGEQQVGLPAVRSHRLRRSLAPPGVWPNLPRGGAAYRALARRQTAANGGSLGA
jgi:hypothetical protein